MGDRCELREHLLSLISRNPLEEREKLDFAFGIGLVGLIRGHGQFLQSVVSASRQCGAVDES
jgi:hypothetical protein